jgi:hypothetical protein
MGVCGDLLFRIIVRMRRRQLSTRAVLVFMDTGASRVGLSPDVDEYVVRRITSEE